MTASIKIGYIYGIPITIHWSFWLVVLWAAAEGGRWIGTVQGAAFAALAILLLFVCVLLHEMGHAFTARGLGVEVKGVTLLPFGGMAQIKNMPEQGWQEFLIAIAGPLVNLFLAVILGAVFLLVWGPSLIVGFLNSPETVLVGIMRSIFNGPNPISLLAYLVTANILLTVFNLIPAFPTDGGRILRALLAMIFSFKTATRIAARSGQTLAALGIVLMLTPYFRAQSLTGVLIGVLVFIGATYEDKVVQARWLLNSLRVADAPFSRDIEAISPDANLNITMEQMLDAPQYDAPVMVDGVLTGILRRDDLLVALQERENYSTVKQLMRTDFPTVALDDSLRAVQHTITTTRFATIPVMENGRLIGLINLHNINQAFMDAGK